MTFHTIYDGKHGKSVSVDNPKLAAYQSVAWAQAAGFGPYSLTVHEDEAITVEIPGLQTLTYES